MSVYHSARVENWIELVAVRAELRPFGFLKSPAAFSEALSGRDQVTSRTGSAQPAGRYSWWGRAQKFELCEY
jgi:hypothetical protein